MRWFRKSVFYIICIMILILSLPISSDARRKKSESYNFYPGAYIPGHVYVKPHFKKNGTYVEGHRRTQKNKSKSDNWSTIGNINPYTGKVGNKNTW